MQILTWVMMAFFFMAAPAMAADDTADASKKAVEKKAEKQIKAIVANPHLKDMNEQAKALVESMSKEEVEALTVVRENFGILGSVEIARKSVEDAISMCAKENPDMANDLNSRFKNWDTKIKKSLSAQDKNLDKAIAKDNFSEPKKVRSYLDTIDKAAKYASDTVEKTIITTEQACTNLMGSMDDTESVIVGMVDKLSWLDEAEKATP